MCLVLNANFILGRVFVQSWILLLPLGYVFMFSRVVYSYPLISFIPRPMIRLPESEAPRLPPQVLGPPIPRLPQLLLLPLGLVFVFFKAVCSH